jgi:hypothetical protein
MTLPFASSPSKENTCCRTQDYALKIGGRVVLINAGSPAADGRAVRSAIIRLHIPA